MARLTNLAEKDITTIAGIYDLEITGFKPIEGGDENSSFLLNADNLDYVLTIYEMRTKKEIEQLTNLLRYLAVHGYQTNRVLPTRESNFVLELQGKAMILKTWIKGKTLRDSLQSDYHSIGRSMAKVHAIPAPGFLPKHHPYGLRYMSRSCGHGKDNEFEAWLVDKIAYLQENSPDGLPQSFIHGDLFDDNILYHQGKFKALIDFAEACHYTRAYDLGSVLFGACMVDGQLDQQRAADVLDGYQSSTRLETEERVSIQYFAVYAGAAISAWHYLHTYLRKPIGKRLDKYRRAATRTDRLFNLAPNVFEGILQ